MTLDDLIDTHRDANIDAQPVGWNRAMWEKVWAADLLAGRETLDLIDAEVAANGTMRRSWLMGLTDTPVVFLVASTIWGYGNYGRRGVPALKAMLQTPNVTDVTNDIIRASRIDCASGFSALFDNGKSRIRQLGIAFGTKVVHFAGYEHADPPPLILDKRVYNAGQVLNLSAIPDPEAFTTGAQYGAYCEWANDAAKRHQVAPCVVEYVLFQYGGALRNEPGAATTV